MPCNKCGGLLEMKDQSGGVTDGPFQESYECLNCGARGYIRGNAEDSPRRWKRTGSAFK